MSPTPDLNPFLPDISFLMPENAFDDFISNLGIRLGWMRAHECPCTQSGSTPGAAQPQCRSCFGRGVYWDQPAKLFTGLITFQHGPGAPDEPGFKISTTIGSEQRAAPTLTIPRNGPLAENEVYTLSASWDAYIQLDGASRLSTTLVAGVQEILPYQQGVQVLSVTVYDASVQKANILSRSQYQVLGARVVLNEPFQVGTAYTVEFTAMPVYVAFHAAGGISHLRPFGKGTGGIPKRFRLENLDVWTRAVSAGEVGPQAPYYLSDKAPPTPASTIPSSALGLEGWA